jgi:hypothetical protein
MAVEYPEVIAVCKKAEATQWEIGDAIVKAIGPTGGKANDGSYAQLEVMSKELLAVGLEYEVDTLRHLRAVSSAFTHGVRTPCSWVVHQIAGTPDMLTKILAVNPNPTRQEAKAIKAQLTGKKPKPKPEGKTKKQEEKKYRDDEIIAMWDSGKTVKEIEKITGLDDRTIYGIIKLEKERRKAAAEATAQAQTEAAKKQAEFEAKFTDEFFTSPEARAYLSKNQQKTLDRTMRAYAKKLEAGFEERLRQEIIKWYDRVTRDTKEQLRRAEQTINSRRGIMSKQEYNSILKCLHPDTARHVSEEVRTEAFRLFDGLRFKVLSAKDDPLKPVTPPPATWEEFKAQQATK